MKIFYETTPGPAESECKYKTQPLTVRLKGETELETTYAIKHRMETPTVEVRGGEMEKTRDWDSDLGSSFYWFCDLLEPMFSEVIMSTF